MSVYDDYNNPDLFKDNPPGEYTYVDTPYGKMAYGQLTLSEDPQRDAKAQREAGGEDRRSGNDSWGKDDGGHLIGARFGGAPDAKNLVPQNSNFNRSTYKSLENSWAEHLEAGDKVYVVVDCYTGTDSQRPSAYTVTTIVEHTDEQGRTTRDIDVFSTINESDKTKEAIDEEQRAFEEAHPEYVEEQRAENTTMEYIWDEDKQEAVKNPYYIPDDPQPENKAEATSEYAPTAEEGAEATAPGQEAASEYAPTAEEGAEATAPGQETVSDYAPTAGSEATTEASTQSQQSSSEYAPSSSQGQSSEGPSSGVDNTSGQSSSGQDMD